MTLTMTVRGQDQIMATSTGSVGTSDAGAVRLWERLGTIGPPLAFILPLAVLWLLGGFDDFQWIGGSVTLAQSFAMLGAMCFPFAVFLYCGARWNQALAHASSAWPTTTGVVNESSVKGSEGRRRPSYRLELRYSYEVDGQSYDGDQAQFGPTRVTEKLPIETLAKRYPQGAQVTVHYDPDDPSTSVLDTSDEMARQMDWRIWYLAAAPFLVSVAVALWNQ
jgi:hypothetical protein